MNNNRIALNFLEITPKTFDIVFYRKEPANISEDERDKFYQTRLRKSDANAETDNFAISFEKNDGFEKYVLPASVNLNLTKRYLFYGLQTYLSQNSIETYSTNEERHLRISFPLTKHKEGIETVWIEPYYLEPSGSFGFLLDFRFCVSQDYINSLGTSSNVRIHQLSGSLDNRGLSNKAFYQFKYSKLNLFFEQFLTKFKEIDLNGTRFSISDKLIELESSSLKTKVYQFSNESENASPYYGLLKNPPFQMPDKQTKFMFIFRESDAASARDLWRGLKGDNSSTSFPGFEKMFRMPFNNDYIIGRKIDEFSQQNLDQVIAEIAAEGEFNILPILLTKSKTTDADDQLYYFIKHSFIKNNIPCQVVTKDLISNTNSLKYSLSNIGLQMFAKSGGKPWKVKPALKECLIIGIGRKDKLIDEVGEDGKRSRRIEKYLSYSVLTDSSGLFKEIQILSETDNEQEYYESLSAKLKNIVSNSINEGVKDFVIHSPFNISKPKVWDSVFDGLPADVNISVLTINDSHKYFGYDLSKNALVPYESSYIRLSFSEYLVWFEGLQYNNSVFSKRPGNPLYIHFWHSNKKALLSDNTHRNNILQDCINLSGANWRGFKAKQLPVSIFYCQRIADFLKSFDEYELEQIKLENLKPWFL